MNPFGVTLASAPTATSHHHHHHYMGVDGGASSSSSPSPSATSILASLAGGGGGGGGSVGGSAGGSLGLGLGGGGGGMSNRDPRSQDAAWIVDAAYMPVSNKLAICALDRTCVPRGFSIQSFFCFILFFHSLPFLSPRPICL